MSSDKQQSNLNSVMNSSAAPAIEVSEDIKAYDTFDEMDLPDNVLRGIYSFGYDKPSKIQRLAIVPIVKGRDMLAQSQSGTGKTGAFTIGTLANVDPTLQAPQVLVLVHTRELAQQHEKVARGIGQYLKVSEHQTGLKVLCAVGGTSVGQDKKTLRAGAQFIVGTPGRIFDLIRQGALKLDQLKHLILDEADQLLEDLFAEQIEAILKTGAFPPSTRLGMFSATMPVEVLDLAERYLQNPVRILTPPEEVRLEGIQQFHILLDREDWKIEALADLYKHMTINQAIIFVNKKQTAEKLTKKMCDEGYTLEYIHGDMEAAERKKRMDDFRAANVRILIATDVLARGIDVQSVSTVINYEMPPSRENYFHRIGRTGRYGRKGLSINLIAGPDEEAMMKDIERHYSITIPHLPEDLTILSKIGQ
jgi:translation initiation factor 4A